MPEMDGGGWRLRERARGSAQVLLMSQSARRAEAGGENDGHNRVKSDSASICIAG